MWFWVLVLLILTYVLTRALIPSAARRFHAVGIVKKNYRNRKLPCGMGVVFGLLSALGAGIMDVLLGPGTGPGTIINQGPVVVGASLFVLLVGFLDDVLGRDAYKGFSGHLQALLGGTLTMGMVKAVGGLLVVSWSMVLVLGPKPLVLFREVLLLLLMMNLINLFDLRPGRAGKVFYGFFVLLVITCSEPERLYMFLPLLVSFSAYFLHDLSAQVMMGDAGAAFLGINLGFMTVFGGGGVLRTALLVMLIVLHLAAERISFSAVIENNSLLARIDKLGVNE